MLTLISVFIFVVAIFSYWEAKKHSIIAIKYSLIQHEQVLSRMILDELDFYLLFTEMLSLEVSKTSDDLLHEVLNKFVVDSNVENVIAVFYDSDKELLISSYVDPRFGLSSSSLMEIFNSEFSKAIFRYVNDDSDFIVVLKDVANSSKKRVSIILNASDFYKFVFNKTMNGHHVFSLWNDYEFVFSGNSCFSEISSAFIPQDKMIESGSFLRGNKCISVVSQSSDNYLNFAITAEKKYAQLVFLKSAVYVAVAKLTILFVFIFLLWIAYVAICADLSLVLSMFNSNNDSLICSNVLNNSLSRINDIAMNVLSLKRDLSLMKRNLKEFAIQRDEASELRKCAFEIVNDVNFKLSKIKSDLISSNLLKKIFEDQSQFYKDQLNAKKEIEKRKSELLANIGHETRTPLNAIIGFSEMILKSKLCNEKGEEYIRIIYDSSRYMSKLIEEIMDFSRGELGGIVLNDEFISLDHLIKSSVEMTSKNYNKCDQPRVKIDIDKNIQVLVDKVKMQQVIINVLSNAIKFASFKVDRWIEIKSVMRNKSVNIVISDNGIGIASVELSSITDLFNQASNSSSVKANDGIGLGLSLSKRIIELHDGLLSIDSVLNKGTEVTIELPANRVKQFFECN